MGRRLAVNMQKKGQAGGSKEGNRFIIDIRYRKNATWQGEVLWVDQNKQCSFRSALELLKLIEGALDRAESGEEIVSLD